MHIMKLTAIGNSAGFIVPKEMLTRMKLTKGDNFYAVETPSGYLLTPYNPEVEEQIRMGQDFIARYRETFRALAK